MKAIKENWNVSANSLFYIFKSEEIRKKLLNSIAKLLKNKAPKELPENHSTYKNDEFSEKFLMNCLAWKTLKKSLMNLVYLTNY